MMSLVVSALAACLLLTCRAGLVQLNATNFNAEFASKDWLIHVYDQKCQGCLSTHKLFADLAREHNQTTSTSTSTSIGLGRVDATTSKGLAKALGVHKYPTILYKEEGQLVVYDGVRNKEVVQVFMQRMQAPAYLNITSLDDLYGQSAFAANVTFVLIHRSEPAPAFAQVAAKMKKGAAFAALLDTHKRYGESRVVRVELGRAPLALAGALSTPALEAFVAANNYPLCGELTQLSFQRLDAIDKIMIVAVLGGDPAPLRQAFASAVAALSPAIANQFIFGVVDGERWRSFVSLHGSRLDSLLVLDNRHALRLTLPLTPTDPHSPQPLDHQVRALLARVVSYDVDMEWRWKIQPSMSERLLTLLAHYMPWTLAIAFLAVLCGLLLLLAPRSKVKS
ncbi:hypothetical protein B484DRAFT_132729 [Ochromonadaceae sp. CCMP2298]|nr:hypothetical protein B484DRAFT_132729 [Ochromonadaceae sp. CCMP2298]